MHEGALILSFTVFSVCLFLFSILIEFMAFRRSLTARAKLFYQQQQQRVALPLSRVDRDDNERRRQVLPIHDLRRGGGGNAGSFSLSGWRNLSGYRRFAAPAAFTPVFVRNMSSNGEGRGAENVAIITDNLEMVNEAAEKAIEAVAPVANEVAAAATGFFPVDAIHHLINHVHTFTGGNWWASIALSTILFRTLLLPLTIYQTRATYIFNLIRPQVEEIQAKSRNEKSPMAVAVGEARMRKLFNEYGFSGYTNTALSITVYTASVFFYEAIFEMVKKVESLKDGGALWFTDLTTPDATLILPVLALCTCFSALECLGAKHLTRGSAGIWVASMVVLLAAFTPKGMLCYWITFNLYGVAYGKVMEKGEVKKMLGIPNVSGMPRTSLDPVALHPSFTEWLVPIHLLATNAQHPLPLPL